MRGVGLFGLTLSFDEFACTLMTAGVNNTLPLEIVGMTTNVTTPVPYALVTVTTAVSFPIIFAFLADINSNGSSRTWVVPSRLHSTC